MKKILVVLSEWGYWGEELLGPLEMFDKAGYKVDFATPKGKRPTALPPSMDATYYDPPLGRTVTDETVDDAVPPGWTSTRLLNARFTNRKLEAAIPSASTPTAVRRILDGRGSTGVFGPSRSMSDQMSGGSI